ncbi:MAG TPA: SUMF1/EgtB/PvdO family nonheme iron enzyme [Thermoanaerobaculia bacterium]|nr:SUMF1/EgtB/PvdO family nonheme iron enzyme [Thermoanaerobaculia bacterium]
MLNRAALALLLLLPAAASAQDLDMALSAVVRISGTRGGTPVRGSGFVVSLDRDKATIVTAAHVVEGAQQLEVAFATDLTESFLAAGVLGMDAGSPNGLAAFQVRGALPEGVTTLSFDVESRPGLGEALFLLGFPEMAPAPRTTQRVLSARSGTLLLIDQGIGEGFSGGPVLQGGKVVGVVTDTDGQTTYAVNAVVAREALEGWGVNLKPCLPGEEITESGIIFGRICTGTFTMGSAENDKDAFDNTKPAHQVTLSEFWIAKTETTNEQYRRFRSDHQGDNRLPVEDVIWADAKAACEHFGGRLPTEAEWEYAARAGSQTAWSFGDNEKELGEYAWYVENSGNMPHPVGTKKPNAWGLHDMHGNVWEWVADWYGTYPSGVQADPSGPTTGKRRLQRGGAYNFHASILKSEFRFQVPEVFWPGGKPRASGFRCVLVHRRQP